MDAAELGRKFAIPGALRFEDTPGGLVRAVVSTASAEADLYLQGAHLAHWMPRGHQPVLFVSPRSLFTPGKAIRGGVPIIFPWFGDRSDGRPGPAHGFARTSEWAVEAAQLNADDDVQITLTLEPNDASRGLGFAAFHARLRVTIGSQLQMELEVNNHAAEPLLFEEAFHSYLAVSDVEQISITGLEGTVYIDKTDGLKRKGQGSEPLRIAKETDQLHLNTQAACVVHDPGWNRSIVVEKAGSRSTVVWNPWIDKTSRLSDMPPDGWKGMICIEAANASDNAVQLAAGASSRMSMSIRVE
jgi:glucose-6-phosphate 1-epimerase